MNKADSPTTPTRQLGHTTSWKTSSRSPDNGGQCVQARLAGPSHQVRDSKLGAASPVLTMNRSDLTALLNCVK